MLTQNIDSSTRYADTVPQTGVHNLTQSHRHTFPADARCWPRPHPPAPAASQRCTQSPLPIVSAGTPTMWGSWPLFFWINLVLRLHLGLYLALSHQEIEIQSEVVSY